MALILTAPDRLALMMFDCHQSIMASYHLVQDNIDYVERPCFLISVEGANFPGVSSEQSQSEESFRLDYIGQTFNTGHAHEYEILAREVADAAVRYVIEHDRLQFSNQRGVQPNKLSPIPHVKWTNIDNRGPITLMQRDGVDEAFWGFSIDITITASYPYEEKLIG